MARPIGKQQSKTSTEKPAASAPEAQSKKAPEARNKKAAPAKRDKEDASDEHWDDRCQARLEQLAPFHPDDEEDDGPNEDMDRFRLTFARRLSIMLGTVEGYWRKCPNGQCRRERMCIAPEGTCANAPPEPDDPDGKLQDQARLEFGLALREEIARRGLGDA